MPSVGSPIRIVYYYYYYYTIIITSLRYIVLGMCVCRMYMLCVNSRFGNNSAIVLYRRIVVLLYFG
jgi:hypothetical protein